MLSLADQVRPAAPQQAAFACHTHSPSSITFAYPSNVCGAFCLSHITLYKVNEQKLHTDFNVTLYGQALAPC